MAKPKSGLTWLRNPPVPELLKDLATGRVALTHEALHTVESWRTAAYLRDLLMTCGVLPTVDKQLLHYETWLHRRLTELADNPHTRLLRQFAALAETTQADLDAWHGIHRRCRVARRGRQRRDSLPDPTYRTRPGEGVDWAMT
jgi:hypothetical protein